MTHGEEEMAMVDAGGSSLPPQRSLCSLRVVPVSSNQFAGRRFVMELTTVGRARELRVYRSLEQLMEGVAELGLSPHLQELLCRQLLQKGSCEMLNILL